MNEVSYYDISKLKDVIQLQDYMKSIQYGWLDSKGDIHIVDSEINPDTYILQTPEQVMQNKIGVCWDQVELERMFFEANNINYETYFIVYYDGDKCPTHTFLIYEINNEWYWFENSYEKYRGIRKYKTKDKLLKDVKNKFLNDLFIKNINKDNLGQFRYLKPPYGIGVANFCNHCENSIENKHIA